MSCNVKMPSCLTWLQSNETTILDIWQIISSSMLTSQVEEAALVSGHLGCGSLTLAAPRTSKKLSGSSGSGWYRIVSEPALPASIEHRDLIARKGYAGPALTGSDKTHCSACWQYACPAV